jgi:hypothetical protein
LPDQALRSILALAGARAADGVRQVSIPSDRDAVREHVITTEEEAKYFAAGAALHALHFKLMKNARPTWRIWRG